MKFQSQGEQSQTIFQSEMPTTLNSLSAPLGFSQNDCELSEIWAKVPVGMTSTHELSASLPNLAMLPDSAAQSEPTEITSYTANSLSDIFHQIDSSESNLGLESVMMNEVQTDSGCHDCSSKEQEGLSNSLPVESDSNGSVQTSKSSDGENANASPNNNRLSAVLENIPLLYIPHTKQLVSVGASSCKSPDSAKELQNGPYFLVTDGADNCSAISICSSVGSQSIDGEPTEQGTVPQDSIGNNTPQQMSCDSDSNAVSEPLSSNIATPSFQSSLSSRGSKFDADSNLTESRDSSQHPSICKAIENKDPSPSTCMLENAESKADASSFSSLSSISTGTDFSVSAASGDDPLPVESKTHTATNEEGGFEEINLQAKSSFEICREVLQENAIDDKSIDQHQSGHGAKPKKKGISGFWNRNLFWKKTKEESSESQGWKLFNKIPPRDENVESLEESGEAEEKSDIDSSTEKVQKATTDVQYCRKKDVEVSSTTALILEQRPLGLPNKDPEEEERHRMEYDAMVEAARKKEQREAKQRKRRKEHQLKHEEAMAAALKVWNSEILPNWENMRSIRRTRDLWWAGIPSSVRGKVWELAIGNDLNLTTELYEICLNRARERLKFARDQLQQQMAGSDTDSISSFSSLSMSEPSSSKEASVELIKLDVSRTFPQLCIFQKGGPYHDLLQSLLGAYVCYRPDVGYVQGMSFIAAVLLLNMDVPTAFICFANLLNRPCQIAFFRLDEILIKSYFESYEEFFAENLPKLFDHFRQLNLTPDLYIIDWMFTLYAKSLPLDVASRVWDVFCRDGEEFLFRTALGILKLYKDILLNMDFIHLAQFLTRLPDTMSVHQLFTCIESVSMQVDKKRFQQVFNNNKESNESKE